MNEIMDPDGIFSEFTTNLLRQAAASKTDATLGCCGNTYHGIVRPASHRVHREVGDCDFPIIQVR